jgi:hypothetical protein
MGIRQLTAARAEHVWAMSRPRPEGEGTPGSLSDQQLPRRRDTEATGEEAVALQHWLDLNA